MAVAELWKQYEHLIAEHFRMIYPNCRILHNVRRKGIYSKTERQIDIFISGNLAGFELNIAIECKYYAVKVDVAIVDKFIGVLGDIRASKGVIITNVGYTEAALKRASNEGRDIEVQILDFEDLDSFSGFCGGILHRDESCALFPCPSGWVVNPEPFLPQFLCVLTRPDVSWDTAMFNREVIYLDVACKSDFPTFDDLSKYQSESTLRGFPEAKIAYDLDPSNPFKPRTERKIYIRRLDYKEYPEPELTVFVEFEKFFFYAVLLAPEAQMEHSLKKLAFIAKMVIPCVRFPMR